MTITAGYNGPQARQDHFQGILGGDADRRAVEGAGDGPGAVMIGTAAGMMKATMTTKRTTWAAQIAVAMLLLAVGTAPASSGLLAENSPPGKNALDGSFHRVLSSVSVEPHRGWGEVCTGSAADSVVAPRAGALENAAKSSPGNLYIGDPLDDFLHLSRQVPARPGYYDVVIHGTQGNLFAYVDRSTGKVVKLTPQQLAQMVLQQADYNGEAIRLISCNAAAPNITAAQELASSTGKMVMAPDKLVFPHAPHPSLPHMLAVTPQGALTTITPGADFLIIADGLAVQPYGTLPVTGTQGNWIWSLPLVKP